MPRHPPYALSSLTIKLTQDEARANSQSAALRICVFPKLQWLPDIQFSKNNRAQLDARTGLLELGSRIKLVENTGIEPMTSCLQGRRSPN